MTHTIDNGVRDRWPARRQGAALDGLDGLIGWGRPESVPDPGSDDPGPDDPIGVPGVVAGPVGVGTGPPGAIDGFPECVSPLAAITV